MSNPNPPPNYRLLRALTGPLLSLGIAAGALAAPRAANAPRRTATPAANANTANTAPVANGVGDIHPNPDPAEQIATLPGFKVETLLKADPKVDGSWIRMAKDDKGRLILGAQNGQPIERVTVKDGQVVEKENLNLPISEAMGLLWANDSLYVNGHGKVPPDAEHPKGYNGFGLFRCRSTKNDDHLDSVQLLREWKAGAGEHGAHEIVLGPDKKIYIVCGNFVGLPDDFLPTSPHRNYQDDRVLPRAEDGNGFGAGKKPPGGFISRMDADGKNIELYASGQRNTYGIGFNADGELLGFDSDMEWDWGTPWYRPIRIFHAVSAADMGFREGSAKWPVNYFDSLPPVVNVGVGSPTGVTFGTGAKFPAKYQKALYVNDWTYGRLIAVHLQPKGASYEATWEDFVAPKSLHAASGKTPLDLTGITVGADGALYFTVGGRGTQAYLFRVTYTGSDSTAPADLHDAASQPARDLRHQLEAFHGHQNAKAVDFAWPHLSSEDRFIRYAARIAIEAQPVDQWKARALSETQPDAALEGLLALARLGGADAQPELLAALAKLPLSSLDPRQQLEKLRVLEVSFSRQGKPTGEAAKQIIAELDPMFPVKSTGDASDDQGLWMNRELAQLLLSLDAPDAVAKTVKVMMAGKTQEDQVGYALFLRTIKDHWTPELRKEYFEWFAPGKRSTNHPADVEKWFADAGRAYADGSSFPNFLAHMHADAEKTLSPEEKQKLEPVLALYSAPAPRRPKNTAAVKPRARIKEWQMQDLEPMLPQVSHGRNFARGQAVFEQAQCLACHRFANEGGAVGPELTAVSSRFQRRDILESILDPSKVVSEQYQNTTYRLKNGDVIEGRLMEDKGSALFVRPNPLKPEELVTIKKSDIKSSAPSKLSPMPTGLVDTFHKEEILDLLAYIESAGNKNHPDFKP